jgi:hypothetical protein
MSVFEFIVLWSIWFQVGYWGIVNVFGPLSTGKLLKIATLALVLGPFLPALVNIYVCCKTRRTK